MMSLRTDRVAVGWSRGVLVVTATLLAAAVWHQTGRAGAPEDSAPAAVNQIPLIPATAVKRGWGPEQVLGKPDTAQAGDIQTAWASQTPDDQQEWLLMEYATATVPKAVVIHETYNPGAVKKVSLFDAEGKEVVAWTGVDPTPRTNARGISVIPVKFKSKIKRVKVYIDSPAVPGWNEIDAIGLRDADGKTQWAVAVAASSTYAQQVPANVATVTIPAADLQRLNALEAEVKRLRKEVDRIKQLEADIQELKKLLKSTRKR